MAGPLPRPITVSPPQQAVLDALLRQHSTPQTLASRVRIVLAAATGLRNVPLALHLGCTPKTVIKWRAGPDGSRAHCGVRGSGGCQSEIGRASCREGV